MNLAVNQTSPFESVPVSEWSCVMSRYRSSLPLGRYGVPRSVIALEQMFDAVGRYGHRVPVEPEPVVEPKLTLLQTVALLRMADSTLARGVATRLQSQSQDKPSIGDYRALVDHGYAFKPEGERWHKITGPGAWKAKQLLSETCKELGIHVMQEGSNKASWQTSFHCSCGGWWVSVRRSDTAWGHANRQFNQHLREANGERVEKIA